MLVSSLSGVLPLAILFAVALVAALSCTPLARAIAVRFGAVDQPGPRRINRSPVPRMGGIAVFCGIVCAFFAQLAGTAWLGWPRVFMPSAYLSVDYRLLACAFVIIFATGLVDDRYQLRPAQKLVGQVAAASVACAGGLIIGVVVNPLTEEGIHLGWLAYPITVCYLVAYVNIFNLIDGLDGLAAGIAVIASLTMCVLSANAGHADAASLAVALAGACLGFLRYNFHPASIFLGDSGSLLIGFALGTVSLLSVTRIAGLTTIIVPLVISAVPIIDTFSAIVRRSRAHVSIGQADAGHIHHRLIAEGFDQRQAVLIMYAWTAAMCLGTFAMTQVELAPRIGIFVVLMVASAALASRLHLTRPVLLHHYNPATGADELVGPSDPAFDEEQARLGKR